jgi:hypothetical protein
VNEDTSRTEPQNPVYPSRPELSSWKAGVSRAKPASGSSTAVVTYDAANSSSSSLVGGAGCRIGHQGDAGAVGAVEEEVAHARHRPACVGVAVHGRDQDGAEPPRLRHARRLLVHDAVERAEDVVGDLVGRVSGQRVEEGGTQRPHVGGVLRTAPGGDLGGQVGG